MTTLQETKPKDSDIDRERPCHYYWPESPNVALCGYVRGSGGKSKTPKGSHTFLECREQNHLTCPLCDLELGLR